MRVKPAAGTCEIVSVLTATPVRSTLRLPTENSATPYWDLRCAAADTSERATTRPSPRLRIQRVSGISLWVGTEIGPQRSPDWTAFWCRSERRLRLASPRKTSSWSKRVMLGEWNAVQTIPTVTAVAVPIAHHRRNEWDLTIVKPP